MVSAEDHSPWKEENVVLFPNVQHTSGRQKHCLIIYITCYDITVFETVTSVFAINHSNIPVLILYLTTISLLIIMPFFVCGVWRNYLTITCCHTCVVCLELPDNLLCDLVGEWVQSYVTVSDWCMKLYTCFKLSWFMREISKSVQSGSTLV